MHRLALSLMFLAAVAVAADNPETLAERSQARAREVVDAAVIAAGGADALQAIETVRLQLEGRTWPRLQMPTPDGPYEGNAFRETLLFDLKNNRLYLDQTFAGGGFEGHTTTILKAGEGTNYDHRAKTATPIPAAQTSQQQFIQYYRRLPNLLLRQALGNANSLRHLGDDLHEGRKHHVVTFVMPDTQQVGVYVDAKTSLISKYELIFTDPLTGEEASEIMFSDYTTAGNLKVPQKWSWRIAGEMQATYDAKVVFNPAVTDKSFEVAEAGYRRLSANPATFEPKVEQLADGVYVIQNVAGNNQNTLAVEFQDYILAVEAPGSSAGADAVITRIKETIPGKPIRYIGVTHHHGDHIGGLRSFIAEGAAVVTTAANRGVVSQMATAPQKDRLAKSPRKPEFALIENGRRVFTDGKQTVELIDIGPNPHAKEMVIAWLPKNKIVFQGDLFFVPNNDAGFGPPQASTIAFARELQKRGLAVEHIASVHGRTATITEFEQAVNGAKASGAD